MAAAEHLADGGDDCEGAVSFGIVAVPQRSGGLQRKASAAPLVGQSSPEVSNVCKFVRPIRHDMTPRRPAWRAVAPCRDPTRRDAAANVLPVKRFCIPHPFRTPDLAREATARTPRLAGWGKAQSGPETQKAP
jgi:hypothetical protein